MTNKRFYVKLMTHAYLGGYKQADWTVVDRHSPGSYLVYSTKEHAEKACENMNKVNETIYAVYATHEDRNQLLGHAVGNVDDIKAFFSDRQAYGLVLEEVEPKIIPNGFAKTKADLIEKKKKLEEEIRKIEQQLK